MNLSNKTQKMVLAGLFIALVYITTCYIKIPGPNGYYHAGDAFVILSGVFLGPIYGAVAAGLGSMLADISLAYGQYAVATLIIKGLMAATAYFVVKKGGKNAIVMAAIIAAAIMIGGYYLFEGAVLYGFEAAVASITWNLFQAFLGVAISVPLYYALKKALGSKGL